MTHGNLWGRFTTCSDSVGSPSYVGNGAYAVAAQLPGTPSKRPDVVKSYYCSCRAAYRPIKAHESALFCAAAKQAAGVYALSGGQGKIEKYFNQLREIFSFHGGLVEKSFGVLCPATFATFARSPHRQKVFQGA